MTCIIVGSTADVVTLGQKQILCGFPRLVWDLPGELRFLSKCINNYYMEVYGCENKVVNLCNINNWKALIEEISLLFGVNSDIRVVVTILLFQIVGNFNDLIFDCHFKCRDADFLAQLFQLFSKVLPGYEGQVVTAH